MTAPVDVLCDRCGNRKSEHVGYSLACPGARLHADKWIEPTPATVTDPVDHPAHYNVAGEKYEAIRVIDDWRLGFSLGNAVKYLLRAKHKGNELEDLRKAHWYLRHAAEVGEHPNTAMHKPAILVAEVAVAWACPDFLQLLSDIKLGRAFDAEIYLRSYLDTYYGGMPK